MKIIDYSNEYDEKLKDLFVELQEYIVEIDREKFNVVTDEFREKYFMKTMEEVSKYEGKIFLAVEDEEIVGAIIGVINNEDIDNYNFKAPKRGRICDLVVSKNHRGMGIGKLLLQTMEDYFKNEGCHGVMLDVFAYNESAYHLYTKLGYFNRTIQMMKNI